MEAMVRLFPRPKSQRGATLYSFLSTTIIGVVGELVLFGLFYLFSSRLLDYSLIVSLWVAEVPLATFLWFLLGEREETARRRTIDAIDKAHAIAEFQHLQIHIHNEWNEYDYPALYYFVVNTKTKKAYWSPEYIHELEEGGIIEATRYESDDEVDDFFKTQQITLEKREPKPNELL
jgi:steroid 5-alpha reductase family enzyme